MKNFFQKLFGGNDKDEAVSQGGEIVTAPLSPENLNKPSVKSHPTRPIIRHKVTQRLEPPQLVAGVGQSVGKQREVNQDSIYIISSTLASNTSQIPFGLYIVADGMGGHQHGEVASETAVRIMADYILRNLYIPLVNPKNVTPTNSMQEIMKTGVLEAHHAILDKTPDGGTTLTTCLILGKQMTIAHVGDSRAYHVENDGTMNLLTHDHSLVRRLEEMGQITAAEAQSHPQRHVLYRALGQGEPFEPEITSHRLPSSGYILICSDGLWGVITENQIASVLASDVSTQVMCQQLVNMANDAGGPDNISVILVRMSD
ncbi:MAG: PP2C family protein-serine/threonine phosphatase [Anaerolineales bacterium]